jgi:NitT/TauT family transport system permease protein
MRKQSQFTSILFNTISIVVIFVLWQVYAIQVDNPYLMPKPEAVISAFVQLFFERETYFVFLMTAIRLLTSLGIAALFGLVLGLISGVRPKFESFMKPFVVTLRTMPAISIIIIIFILFGNTATLYIISFLLLFPIIYQAELDGIKNINKTLLEVLWMDCDRCNWPAIKMMFLPLSMPFYRTGLLQSIGLGLKVLVVAEYITQTKHSIGWELYINRINLDYSRVFAWTIVLIITVSLIEYFVRKSLRYMTEQ